MSINKINKTVVAQEFKDWVNTKASISDLLVVQNDIQNMIDDINANLGIIRKPSVATFDDLTTTYPLPNQGWTVKVNDTNLTYRYDEGSDTWYVITTTEVPSASQSEDGLMRKEDKAKLDGIEDGSEKNLTPEETLDSLKPIVGHDSGFDADTVDGKHADEFSPTVHNHDGSYYKKNEVDIKINSKANIIALNTHTQDLDIHTNLSEKKKWDENNTHIGSVAPSDDSLFWLDSDNTKLRYFNVANSEWVDISPSQKELIDFIESTNTNLSTKATKTELIDLKDTMSFADVRIITFVVNNDVEEGVQTAHIPFLFDGQIEEVNAYCVGRGTSDTHIRVEKSTNMNDWNTISVNDITIPATRNFDDKSHMLFDNDVEKEEVFRIFVENSGGISNLTVSIKIKIKNLPSNI